METAEKRAWIECPRCHGEVWDLAHGHHLNKCWGCLLAFDSWDDEDESDEA